MDVRGPILILLAALMFGGGCRKEARSRPAPEAAEAKAPARDAAVAVEPAPLSPVDAEPKVPPPPPRTPKHARGDCSTDYAPRPTRDPNPMCKVEGGAFMFGAPDDDRQEQELPQTRKEVAGFYMDQLEVTVAQVVHFLNAVGRNDMCPRSFTGDCFVTTANSQEWMTIRPLPDGRFTAKPGTEAMPFDGASAQGAALYCEWAGKRLPTEIEWEYAARHDPKTGRDYRYPWGDTFEPKRADCKEEFCKDGFEGTSPDGYAPVGSFDGTGGLRDGSSPWGIHDMVGGAAELTWTCFELDRVATVTPPSCVRYASRGSGFGGSPFNLRANRRFGLPSAGFRCIREAQ